MDFPRLLSESDVISIHLPLTPRTRHIFTWETFQKMKKGAYLINTGRGPLIKEEDLVKALETPHIGSASVKARGTMSLMVAEAVADVLHGRIPEHKVAGP